MGIIERISEAEAVRDFGGLIERVRTRGTSIEIVRGEEVVARLSSGLAETCDVSREPTYGTIDALLKAFENVPELPPKEREAWEHELAELRQQVPVQSVPTT